MAVQIEEAKSEAQRAKPVAGMFRALSHRNFRLFWAGAFLSNVGTWMQAVAQGWLVFQLTNSPFWLGVDGFMATAPGLLLTLAGGVFADLIDRRRILLYTQISAGLSAFTLAVLVSAHVVRDASHVWIILLLTFWTGCCMALAGPSYQAITIDMVGREDLANAIALNSTQFQLSRVVGPAFAGFALNWLGMAGCFFANGVSYIAVVGALMMVRFDGVAAHARPHAGAEGHTFWLDLVEGLRYVRRRQRVFMLLMISAVTSLFGAPYLSMMPLFARDILHLNESGLALMLGMAGAGSFVGALFVTYLGDFRYKGWSVLGGVWAFGLCLIGFSFSTRPAMSLVYLFLMGFAIVCSIAVTNTLLQQLVTDEMRGRVMSMFILSFIGAMPIGNLLAGSGAQRFGAPRTLATGGLVITLFATYLAIRNKRLRTLH
jgi:MFS family permease